MASLIAVGRRGVLVQGFVARVGVEWNLGACRALRKQSLHVPRQWEETVRFFVF